MTAELQGKKKKKKSGKKKKQDVVDVISASNNNANICKTQEVCESKNIDNEQVCFEDSSASSSSCTRTLFLAIILGKIIKCC